MLSISNFTFLLQDALSEHSQHQALLRAEYLFPTSDLTALLHNTSFTDSLQCLNVTDGGLTHKIMSMSDGCGSVENIFLNWPNFYTCSWYPSLVQELETLGTNSTETTTLNNLGVFESQRELSPSISSSIASCLSDYCQSTSTCLTLDKQDSCSYENLLTTSDSVSILNRTSAFACLRDNVCATTTEVNPDIGGLGVIVSLLVQYSISIIALLIHAMIYLKFRLTCTAHTDPTFPCPAQNAYKHHLSTLHSALTEFQKSQCFFASTLQIASLILLPTFSEGSHIKDKILLRLTSANAFAPITFSLAHLQLLSAHIKPKAPNLPNTPTDKNRNNSMYLLLLSAFTFAVGSAVYWFSFPHYGGGFEYFHYSPPSKPILSCGNIAPFAPCFMENQFYLFEFDGWTGERGIVYNGLGESTGLVVWIFSFAVIVYRIFAAFWEKRVTLRERPREVWDQMVRDISVLKQRIISMRPPRGVRIVLDFWLVSIIIAALAKVLKSLRIFLGKGTSWLYIQIFMGSIAVLMQLVSAIRVLILSANIIATEMGFGQIVAVGIWIPILLEYAYLEIVGAYRIRKKKQTSTQLVPIVAALEEPDISDSESEPKPASIVEMLPPQQRRFPTI